MTRERTPREVLEEARGHADRLLELAAERESATSNLYKAIAALESGRACMLVHPDDLAAARKQVETAIGGPVRVSGSALLSRGQWCIVMGQERLGAELIGRPLDR